MENLNKKLNQYQMEGELFRPLQSSAIQCLSCANRCILQIGQTGICHYRQNIAGNLIVPANYFTAIASDPIEKKPLFHFYPSSNVLSFGMFGCNLHCPFCQNWQISQNKTLQKNRIQPCTTEQYITLAQQQQINIIASTYNEPLVSNEWAVKIFKLAKQHQLKTCYVSNGFATPEAVQFLTPVLDAINIDLKCFNDNNYQTIGGKLQDVLNTIQQFLANGVWVEITTLLVPNFNDSNQEIENIAQFIATQSPHIPWHISACYPCYKDLHKYQPTTTATIQKAIKIAKQAGLHHVYSGNISQIVNSENTYCHNCGTLLIQRLQYNVIQNKIKQQKCPKCNTKIAGYF